MIGINENMDSKICNIKHDMVHTKCVSSSKSKQTKCKEQNNKAIVILARTPQNY